MIWKQWSLKEDLPNQSHLCLPWEVSFRKGLALKKNFILHQGKDLTPKYVLKWESLRNRHKSNTVGGVFQNRPPVSFSVDKSLIFSYYCSSPFCPQASFYTICRSLSPLTFSHASCLSLFSLVTSPGYPFPSALFFIHLGWIALRLAWY